MNFLKDILLQLFFLVTPLLLYYNLVHKRYDKPSEFRRQLAVFIYCTASAILCIQFPLFLSDGSAFYLSGIPIIMAILYGGYLSGFLTVMVLFTAPFFLSSNADYFQTYFVTPFLILLPLLIQPRWKTLPKTKKYMLTFFTAIIGFFLFAFSALMKYQFGSLNGSFSEYIQTAIGGGVIFVGAVMIIIYLIEYYCGLEQLHNQLKKMRKLSHINTLADEVSEEFQKPLTIVKGFTQLLGAEQNKTNKEYVPIILTELNRAEKIIDSYIKLAKTESFPSRTISSKELLEVVIQTIQTYARNNQVHLHINKVRNLRIKGNMELLTESFNSILKFCIDANDGSNKVIQINHYLKKNDVIFEVVLKEGNIKEEQIETLRHLPVLLNQQENAPLQAACTILFAHGGDIQLRDHLFKRKSLILTLPAQIKKRSTLRSKVVSTN